MRLNPTRRRLSWSKAASPMREAGEIHLLRVSAEGESAYGQAKRARVRVPGKNPVGVDRRGPYRKPTQVGGLNMLRRSGELTLRNSAKCTRNFGRSVALGGVKLTGGCRESAQATVYQKHRSLRNCKVTYRG